MAKVILGIDQINENKHLFDGNIALLSHSASVTSDLRHSAIVFKEVFGERLTKLFGPQHGFVTDVQDNMVETQDFHHPYFNIPVHSLYGETRQPTKEMLKGIDTFVIDLQDVGTRVYTYIHTMSLAMEACREEGIKVIVLDRPNPIGGTKIEGPLLDPKFKSFVGLHPIPQRHALTIGEMALLINEQFISPCNLEVLSMKNWDRKMSWKDTGLTWINPSPNLSTPESCYSFVGTVLFEGTNISEGRGTTRALEFVGHPDIEPFRFAEHLNKNYTSEGIYFRPQVFLPTFQKFKGEVCGGVQLHVTDQDSGSPWLAGQYLCRELMNILGEKFQWSTAPYEYEFEGMPIDFINGTDQLRFWCEGNSSLSEIEELINDSVFGFAQNNKLY